MRFINFVGFCTLFCLSGRDIFGSLSVSVFRFFLLIFGDFSTPPVSVGINYLFSVVFVLFC